MTQLEKIKRSIAIALCAFLVSFGVSKTESAQAQDPISIAAVVNDDIISVLDLSMRLRIALNSARLANTKENQQRLAPQVLRTLIDEHLQEQQAKQMNITLRKEEFGRAVNNIEAKNGLPPGGLHKVAQSLHVPYDVLTNQIRVRALWIKVIRRKFRAQARASDEDVQDRLEQLQANLGKPEHFVSEIYLPFDKRVTPEDVKIFAENLVHQLRLGAQFPAAARQFSRSASSANGGTLGWVPQGQLEPEIDMALAGMKKGDISNPIRTATGYYIIKLASRRMSQAPDLSKTRVRLSQIKLPLSGAVSLSLEDQNKVTQYISSSIRGCEAFDAYGKTLATPGTGSLGSLNVNQMPETISQATSNLAVGEPSQPTTIGGVTTILMVCERIVPSNLPSKDQVRSTIQIERLERNAHRFLQDLHHTAIIDIRI